MRRSHLIIALALATQAFCACGGPAYTMAPPKAFKQYENTRDYKLITADGVMLKAREVSNYPKADLGFWTDAMVEHLLARGYTLAKKTCFTSKIGLPGCTLTFALPHGAEDWVLSETLFVVDERLVLVEAAGSFERFTAIQTDLERSLLSFNPGK